jgi:argininosuccinate lyase
MVKVDIRGKRLNRFSDESLRFTSSIKFDHPIAKHVVRINMAYTLSLMDKGFIDGSTAKKILSALLELLEGEPTVDRHVEDIHDAVEQHLVNKLGVEVGGYLNWGKSRNDQVATALRMAVRERLIALSAGTLNLQKELLRLAGLHADTPFPGYTHLQRAQLVTLGHHFLAYFESLSRAQQRIRQSYGRVNVCPMGSAALAGSYVGVDRRRLAGLLGFSEVMSNSVDAVSSRDFAIEAIFVCVLIMLELSKMAEELILWTTTEFGFVELGDEWTSSSSLMPQKKNPVVAETIRAKTSTVIGQLVSASSALKGLPYAYNLDFQEVTRALWTALDDTYESVNIMAEMIGSLSFKAEALAKVAADQVFGATALAHILTQSGEVSFRQAHLIVGGLVKLALERGLSLKDALQTSFKQVCEETVGRALNVDVSWLASCLEPGRLLSMIATEGGSNPKSIGDAVAEKHVFLKECESWVTQASALIAESYAQLVDLTKNVLNGGEKVGGNMHRV